MTKPNKIQNQITQIHVYTFILITHMTLQMMFHEGTNEQFKYFCCSTRGLMKAVDFS